jgi:glycosyltransferase involved in cell wall biosynthesis
LNIWVLNYFAGSPISGWGERHFYLSKKWLDDGHKVTVVSSTYNHMFSHYARADHQFNFESIDDRLFCWIKTPHYRPQSVKRFWAMIVFALKAYFVPITQAGRPDMIIVSSMPIFSVITGWFLKSRYRARKLIFEIRDLWPLTPIHLMGYSRRHPMIMLMAWVEKFGYRKADHIVSVLPNAACYVNSISKNPGKFNYIPNGISEGMLGNEQLPEDIERLVPKNKFIVGYAGTLGLANALEYFAEAASILTDHPYIHLILVGDGYLKQSLVEKTTGLTNITYTPKLRKSYMQSLLGHFDICFIGRNNSPLFDHGVSSNKYFDYMLASKPVLVSSNKIKDPVELSGCGIIVEPDSARAIAGGVLKLFSLPPEERKAMGKKGREYVLKYHNFTYLSKQYEKLFV